MPNPQTRFIPRSAVSLCSLVAVLALLFVNVGFVAVYHVSKMRWYHQQLEAKRGEETVTLHLTHEQFKSCRVEKHEWKIDGEMYDMRSYETTDNGVVMIAVHDEHEKNLLAILTAGFDYDSGHSSPLQQWLKTFNNPAVTVSGVEIVPTYFHSFVMYAPVTCLSRLCSDVLERPPLV